MCKKVGLIIWKLPMLKAYAPVMRELLAREVEIFLLVIPLPSGIVSRDLEGQALTDFNEEFFQDKLRCLWCSGVDRFPNMIKDNSIDSLLITDFYKDTFAGIIDELYRQKVEIFCLQWYADLLALDGELLKYIKKIFVYSDYYTDIFIQSVFSDTKQTMDKLLVVGNPLYDCVVDIKNNKELIYQKYHLPLDKKVVLMTTQHLPYFASFGRIWLALRSAMKLDFDSFFKIIFAPSFKQIFQSIKKWCEDNEAILIVKSRAKHDEPNYVKKGADIFLTDHNQWYPAVSLELLSVANLCIGVWSASVIEAAYSEVYNITISPPSFSMPNDAPNNRFLNKELFANRGVTECVRYDEVSSFLKSHRLKDFKMNEENRKEYLAKFAGPTDGLASKRIVDYILNN